MSACERRLASSPKRSAPSNHRRQEPRPSFKGSGSAPFADTANHAPKSSSAASATGATLDIETQHASTTSTRLQKYGNGVRRQTPTLAARYPKHSTAPAPRGVSHPDEPNGPGFQVLHRPDYLVRARGFQPAQHGAAPANIGDRELDVLARHRIDERRVLGRAFSGVRGRVHGGADLG